MCDYVTPLPTPFLFWWLHFFKYAGYSCSSECRCIAVSGGRDDNLFHTLFCLLYLHDRVHVSMFSTHCPKTLLTESDGKPLVKICSFLVSVFFLLFFFLQAALILILIFWHFLSFRDLLLVNFNCDRGLSIFAVMGHVY